MPGDSIFQRNLLALSALDPVLSGRLTHSGAPPRIRFSPARNGSLVPSLVSNNRTYPLHSTFEPEKEGERFYASWFQARGTLIFLGMGGAYHITSFLKCTDVASLIIVERYLSDFIEIMKNIDLREILLDKRVSILTGLEPADIGQKLMQLYLPVLTGDLQTVPLLTVTRIDEDYYRDVADAIRVSADHIKEDHSVQCYFGRRWFHNTLFNLAAASRSALTLAPVRNAIVTAAGPSLEAQLPEIKKLHGNGFLIATDTSLPFLLDKNIRPDCVISLDCQQISYHHFLKGYPRDIPLILDLASPPGLTRLTDKLIFFTSGHPLSSFINRYLRPFPEVDTSGGNVTHAAVSLAESLCAERIYLFGADFSYPQGRPYVRGTYIYSYFQSLSDRLNPYDSRVFRFIFRNPVIREKDKNSFRYLTLPMIRYREYLEKKASSMKIPVIAGQGDGIPLNFPARTDYKRPSTLNFFGSGSSMDNWTIFLKEYKKEIEKLPTLKMPYIHYFESLTPRERQVWSTLLPGAAHFLKTGFNSLESLEKSSQWSMEQIELVLEREKA
jgi:hypothetical protein